MGTVSNIIAGPLSVYTATVGTSLPEIDDITPPTVTVTPGASWTQIGYTVDDFDLEPSSDFDAVEINESRLPVDHVAIKEALTFSYKEQEKDAAAFNRALATSTLTNTAAAADQTAQSIVSFGDGAVTKKALLILGTNPAGGSRLIHVYKAVVTKPPKFTFGKKTSGHTIGWEAEADMSQSAGSRAFKMYDITAAASS